MKGTRTTLACLRAAHNIPIGGNTEIKPASRNALTGQCRDESPVLFYWREFVAAVRIEGFVPALVIGATLIGLPWIVAAIMFGLAP